MPPKKKYASKFKIQLVAGAATPAPPVGPILGQYGVNIQQFCVAYNDGTADFKGSGLKIPVICYVFEDKSFELEFKTPLTSNLIKKELGIAKGSARPNTEKIGKITRKQLEAERFILYLQEPLAVLPQVPGFHFWRQDDVTLEVEVPKEMGMSRLFAALNQQNIKITSLRNKTNRLEELFLRLTTEKAT